MGFFDLNIPYLESDRRLGDKSSLKANRLKLTVKAAELGYSGVAYNRVIKGVMSDSDRCSIPLFSLASVIKLAPALSAAVKFHRELLKVPVRAPFRQYTRLTVVVDSPAQAAALNSGNPVLKTYDIVAIRPLNQNSFEQACQTAEVDIIAIEFSEKLPFRLKQSMVQAAIKRGVYFEISYTGLIGDPQSRRQTIASAKQLVDWTRRKNLIVSSAAPLASELRGPYDVANLLFLLGLPFEHAKAAISSNCRSVVEVALRKKHYYKEAIKVEVMPTSGNLNSENPALSDWLNWDPISSGEGDLVLDDFEKFFSAAGSVSNTVDTIKFSSALNSLPFGLNIKEVFSTEKSSSKIPDGAKNLSATVVPVAVHGISEEPCMLNHQSQDSQTDEKIRHQCLSPRDSEIQALSSATVNDSSKVEEKSNLIAIEVLRSLKESEACFPSSDVKLHCLDVPSYLESNNDQVLVTTEDARIINCKKDGQIAQVSEENSIYSKEIIQSSHGVESATPISSHLDLFVVDNSVQEGKNEIAPENEKKPHFALSGVPSNVKSVDNIHIEEKSVDFAITDDLFPSVKHFALSGVPSNVKSVDNLHIEEKSVDFAITDDLFPHDDLTLRETDLVSVVEPMQVDILEEQREIKDPVAMQSELPGKSMPGGRRVKRRTGSQLFPFHLKRILNVKPFKKKTRK